MMQRLLCALVFLSLLAVAAVDVAADGPIGFNTPGAVSYANGEYYLTIPEIDFAGTEIWVTWKFNWTNAAWDVVAGDLTTNVKGSRTATGRYIFNAAKGILILDIGFSDYQGCGLWVGKETIYVESLSATTLNMRDPFDDVRMTLTRSGGSPGDVVGVWNYTAGPNTYIMTLNSDRSFVFTGNIVTCSDD